MAFIPVLVGDGKVLNMDKVSGIFIRDSEKHPELFKLEFCVSEDSDSYDVEVGEFRTVREAETHLVRIFHESLNIQQQIYRPKIEIVIKKKEKE